MKFNSIPSSFHLQSIFILSLSSIPSILSLFHSISTFYYILFHQSSIALSIALFYLHSIFISFSLHSLHSIPSSFHLQSIFILFYLLFHLNSIHHYHSILKLINLKINCYYPYQIAHFVISANFPFQSSSVSESSK